MSTIFERIRRDHNVQRTLVDLLIETEGASERRKELFERLTTELVAHAGAEERYFYIPLMEDDLTQDNARHSVAEHKELDEFVEGLKQTDLSAPEWLKTAKKLAERLKHHLEEEEFEVFPVAGRVLTDSQKEELAADYDADIERRRSDR